ncbi:hypothetical protein FUT87_25275, partial [Mitsuaria sp. TWR114]
MQALLDVIATLPRPSGPGRFFHGRGGLFPGCEQWVLDAYPPVWVLTSFAPVNDEDLARIGAALAARWAEVAPGEPLNWMFQHRDEHRPTNRLMAGAIPDEHVVEEDGARFVVHLAQGQNHGFFLDMAEGRRWVRRWAAAHPGGRVLNLFAYTCAFSVVALQAGAAAVANYDMARSALLWSFWPVSTMTLVPGSSSISFSSRRKPSEVESWSGGRPRSIVTTGGLWRRNCSTALATSSAVTDSKRSIDHLSCFCSARSSSTMSSEGG